MKSDREDKVYRIIGMYIVAFIALSYLCYIFPYTGDDWAWGSSIGLERLAIWFDNYNGRYAGNIAVLILTRGKVFKAIFESLCLLGIVYLIVPHGKNRFFNTAVGIMLIVSIPKFLMRQAIVWTAGFSNYVISIALVLIYIRYVYRLIILDKTELPRFNKWMTIPMGVLAFISALFVEHVTIYMIILSVSVILYTLYKFKKVFAVHIGYFVGSFLGAVYMFSNEAYHTISENQDSYRTISTGSSLIHRMLNNYFETVSKELFLNNLVLNFCILGVTILLFIKYKDAITKGFVRSVAYLSIIAIAITCIFSIIIDIFSVCFHNDIGSNKIYGLITMLFCLGLVLFCFSAITDKVLKQKLIFLVGSIAFLTGPLLAVTPIGSRCFFPSYVMFSFFVLEGLGTIKIKKHMYALVIVAILVALGNLLRIYVPIYYADKQRLNDVRAAVAERKIEAEIPGLPHEDYLWWPVPVTGTVWEERYKLFYDIPQEIKLINIKYQEE